MATGVPKDTKKNGSWLLLGEFKINNVDDEDQHLTRQISEIFRGLNIQPSQLRRILDALMEVIQKASLLREHGQDNSPILLRIWADKDCFCDRGWGFFVVEQPHSYSQNMVRLTMYLVELFLYQE